MSFEDQPENDNQNPDQEHKYRNPVDRIHIADPGTGRFIRIFFPYVQIFGKFAKDANNNTKKIIHWSFPDLSGMDIFAARFGGISSSGRALAWHVRGDRFDPGILHPAPAYCRGFSIPAVCSRRSIPRQQLKSGP